MFRAKGDPRMGSGAQRSLIAIELALALIDLCKAAKLPLALNFGMAKRDEVLPARPVKLSALSDRFPVNCSVCVVSGVSPKQV